MLTAAPASAQTLPSGWTATNVGNPTPPGSATATNGTFTIEGSGQFAGGSERFMYVHRQITGDATIVARVLSIANAASSSARAGVMIRQALTTTSPFVFAAVTPSRGAQYFVRNSNGSSSSLVVPATAPPTWLRLERRGSTVTASWSRDGSLWMPFSSGTIASGSPVYVGMAVASQSPSTATATIDNVMVTGDGGGADTTPPSVAITNPANNSQVSGSVNITANASDNVGVTSVTFRVDGTVVGTPDTTLPYSATWDATPGNHTITAEAADAAGNRTTSATVNVSVAASNQPPSATITSPSDGATYTAPASIAISANASDADGTVARVDFFAGSTQIGSDTTSPYTFTWSNVQQGTHVLTAVARDNLGASTTSPAIAVTVNPSGGTGTWTSTNVGNPTPAGSMQQSGSTYTVQGSGSIGETADSFMYVHQQVSGDTTIVARVASITNAASGSARVGVMMREALTTTSPMAFAALSASRGSQFLYRTAAGAGSGVDASGTAPDWVRLERRGATVTASHSRDGVNWTSLGTSSLASGPIYVGLAVASQSSGSAVTGTLDSVSVSGGGGTGGDTTAPTVAITAPANNSQVNGSVTITANASDNVGIASVTFRADGVVIGTPDTSAPYSVVWNATGPGSHVLTAEAADAAGNRTTSAPVTVTVQGTNQPPTVALTAPANGATYTAPATIAMTATASDSDGSIARVDFFAGSTLLGSDSSSPYAFSWSGAPAGTHTLTAVARDDAGSTTTSAPVSVTVNAPPLPTRAVFNPSPDHATTAVSRYELEIFTNGADPATATPVQTQDLGKPTPANGECSVDIAATIQSLPSGTYIATVKAIGPGGTARSVASAPFTR